MTKKIAFFDFDGTLTYRDSTTLFYKSLYKSKLIYYYYNYFLCLFEIFIIFFDKKKYFKLKKKRFHNNLNRLTVRKFLLLSNSFKSNILPKIMKQSGLDCIHEHKKNGTVVCIVSASYEFLLDDWCSKNSISLISNKIYANDNDFRFDDLDCNFENKVTKITENYILNDFEYIYAYGDSIGDFSMLSIANEKYYNYFN